MMCCIFGHQACRSKSRVINVEYHSITHEYICQRESCGQVFQKTTKYSFEVRDAIQRAKDDAEQAAAERLNEMRAQMDADRKSPSAVRSLEAELAREKRRADFLKGCNDRKREYMRRHSVQTRKNYFEKIELRKDATAKARDLNTLLSLCDAKTKKKFEKLRTKTLWTAAPEHVNCRSAPLPVNDPSADDWS